MYKLSALITVVLFSTPALAQRVLVGRTHEFQSASAVGARVLVGGYFYDAEKVKSLCLATFTPPSRTITPTNPAATRTATTLPRIPCAYPPGITPHSLTRGLVSTYLFQFNELRTSSIRDVGTYDISCTNFAVKFDPVLGDAVPPGSIPIGCGETWYPREYEAPLLTTSFHVEVYNNRPTVNVTHGGDGVLGANDVAHDAVITLDSGASDLDGSTTVTWRIATRPMRGRATLSSTSGASVNIAFTGEDDFGDWTFVATVDDQQGERVEQSYPLRVVSEAPHPIISGAARVRVHNDIHLTATTDEDGGDYTALQWEALAPGSSTWMPVGMSGSLTLTLPTTRASLGTWQFRVRVTDNELAAGMSDPFSVEVYNELPVVMASGPLRIRTGHSFALTSTASDPDGGPVTVRWLVIQAPTAAGAPLGVPQSTWPAASRPGTWVFRAQAEDDEGGTANSLPVAVVVDAHPIAAIEGPATITVRGAFELNDLSYDPDSECPPSAPPDPMRCHSVAPGERFTPLSGAITRRSWHVDSVPTGYELFHPPGLIGETFHGVTSGFSRTLRVEAGQMPVGEYRLRVQVEDAEGNSSSASVQVRVQVPYLPPVARINVPRRYLVDGTHHPIGEISFDGSLSFDFDDVLTEVGVPPGGLGILNYLWAFTPPMGCPSGAVTASGPAVTLFTPSDALDDRCLGVWNVALQVTDNDPTPLVGVVSQDFVIGRCDGLVCIDRPTNERPELVDTGSAPDVPIYYYVEPELAARYPGGFYGVVDIIASGSTTPTFTLYDTAIATRPPGTLNVVHWHGERSIGSPPTGVGVASSGTYDVRVRLLVAGAGYAPEQATAPMAISFENVTVTIADTSTRFTRHQDLEADANFPRFEWSTSGAISVDHVRFLVTRVGAGVALDTTVATTRSLDAFVWNGRTSTGSLLPAGDYDLQVSPLRGTRILATSAPFRFTVYRLHAGPASGSVRVGLNDDDDNHDGTPDSAQLNVLGEDDLARLPVTVEPSALAGSLEVVALTPGVAVFVGPDKIAAAGSTPRPSFAIPNYHAEGRAPGRQRVAVRFTPTGHPALPDEEAAVDVTSIEFFSRTGPRLTSLRPGLWDYAFDYSTPTPSIVNNPHDTFIEVDDDAFRVRVIDPAANRSPSSQEIVTIELGTLAAWPVAAGAETWADPYTSVSLRETGPDTGIFEGEPQLLTVNDELMNRDDGFAVRSEFVSGLVADESSDDRTHSIMAPGFSPLGAGVRVRYGGASGQTASVPVCGRAPDERRVVNLVMAALEEPWDDTATPNGRWDPGEPYVDLSTGKTMMLADGTPGLDGHGAAINQAGVDAYLRVANLAWAPACIEFRATPLTVISPPGLIAPASPLHDGIINLDTERDAVFSAIRSSSLAPLRLDAITIVFGFGDCQRGTSTAACLAVTEAPGYRPSLFPEVMILHGTMADNPSRRTFAHELGHAMTNEDTDLTEGFPHQFYPSTGAISDADYLFRHYSTRIQQVVRMPRPGVGDAGNAFLQPYPVTP